MEIASAVQTICVYAIPLIFAITMHEASHGFAAKLLGDNTAYYLGRVTLNPIPHIDPIGTIALPAGMIILGMIATGGIPFVFGYAKPVPVIPRYFRNIRRDMMLVALAGPAANLIQMVFWALVLKVLVLSGTNSEFFLRVCEAGVFTNLFIMAFNLIPIPPLDGGKVLSGLLPRSLSEKFDMLENYGMIILIALIMTNAVDFLVKPFIYFGQWVLWLVI